jgi:hypothetical protein
LFWFMMTTRSLSDPESSEVLVNVATHRSLRMGTVFSFHATESSSRRRM